MKKRNRAAALGMGVILAAGMLAGCSSGGDSAETTAAAAADTTAAAASGDTEAAEEGSGEAITLRFVSWQSNHAEGDQRIVDAWEAEHPDIQVEIEYLGDMNSNDYLQKTDLMLMGGEEIDIMMSPSIQSMAVRAASGSYLPLDEYFEAEGVTPEDAYDIVVRNDEQVYSIFSDIRYNNVILINKDMLEAAGLSMPDQNWTWDDYREYAIAMTQGSGANTIYGSYIHSWGSQNLLGVYSAKPDNAFFNDDGSLTFGNPEFRDFLQFRYDLENVDKASTPLADVKALNMNYRDQFFSGKIAMLPMGTNLLSDVGNEIYAHDFVTAFAPCPLWNADDTRYNPVGGIYYHIAKTSAHPQEAFEFLRFWTTEGVPLKAMFTSNEKGVDKMESTKAIVAGFEDLVDLDSLEALMENPDGVETYDSFAPEYQSQVETVLNEETDKFLLGSQSLDDTINNLLTRGNEIIEENQ